MNAAPSFPGAARADTTWGVGLHRLTAGATDSKIRIEEVRLQANLWRNDPFVEMSTNGIVALANQHADRFRGRSLLLTLDDLAAHGVASSPGGDTGLQTRRSTAP